MFLSLLLLQTSIRKLASCFVFLHIYLSQLRCCCSFYSIRCWPEPASSHLSARRWPCCNIIFLCILFRNSSSLFRIVSCRPAFCHLNNPSCELIAYCLFVSALESFGGQRLLQRADINVGSNVVSFFRIRARTTGKVGGKDLRQLTCFGEWRRSPCSLNSKPIIWKKYITLFYPLSLKKTFVYPW